MQIKLFVITSGLLPVWEQQLRLAPGSAGWSKLLLLPLPSPDLHPFLPFVRACAPCFTLPAFASPFITGFRVWYTRKNWNSRWCQVSLSALLKPKIAFLWARALVLCPSLFESLGSIWSRALSYSDLAIIMTNEFIMQKTESRHLFEQWLLLSWHSKVLRTVTYQPCVNLWRVLCTLYLVVFNGYWDILSVIM